MRHRGGSLEIADGDDRLSARDRYAWQRSLLHDVSPTPPYALKDLAGFPPLAHGHVESDRAGAHIEDDDGDLGWQGTAHSVDPPAGQKSGERARAQGGVA